MNFLDRVRGAWWMLRAVVKAAPYTMRTWPAGQPQWTAHNYANYVREGYAKNTLVYACIREIATSAAEARWEVQRNGEPVPDHGLQQVLDRPNQYFSSFELWELMLTYLNLDGNAFLLKERSSAGRVVALWPMRPDLVAPVPSDGGELLGYVYRQGNERTPWLVEDIIHLRYPNPHDPLEGLGRGMSPLTVAARETDVDNAATDFLKSFFENAAVPFGILKSKQQLVETEVKRIRARLKEQYTGQRNWNEIMILDADAEYQPLGLDMQEMAFPDLRALSESRVCMVFGVPPILIGAKVGLDRSTFSNYGEARKSFWQETLSPIYKRIEDALNSHLVADFGDRRLHVICDLAQVEALQESRDKQFERARAAVSGGWGTVNDARSEVGWEPVPGGDVFLRPLSLVEVAPVGGGGESKRLLPAAIKGGLSDEAATRFGRLVDRVAASWEPQFQAKAAELLRAEKAVVVERLERFKSAKAAQIDWVALNTNVEQVLREREGNWREGFIPLFEGLVRDQGDVITASFGIDFSLQNPEIQTFIRDYSFQFAEKVSSTAVEEIRALASQAQAEGWGILEFIAAVEDRYDEWTEWRAELIARSETIRFSNAGARASYAAAGVTQIQWWTAEDERVCPFCGEMHGKIIGINTVFWQKGQEMRVELPDEEAAANLTLEFAEVHAGEWAWFGAVFRTEKRVVRLKLDYEDIKHPPLHPLCRCTILPVLPVIGQ